MDGTCEAEGFCSFPDEECPSGRRFEPNAGDALAGQCTTPPCGALGQACCADDLPCGSGTFCGSGTCQQCVTAIALGNHFTCSIRYDRTVWCSGESSSGQLGNGTITPPMPPATAVQVSDAAAPISDASAVAAGREFACAVRGGGTVWCWGLGSSGQLGNALSVNQPRAVQVVKAGMAPLDQIVEIAAGSGFACGRDAAGGVWCWGANLLGELGDGTTTTRNVAAPVRVAALGAPFTGASELQVGGSHACARKAGELWCWGGNTTGQLGDTTSTNRPVPITRGSPLGFALGAQHSCFIDTDTTLACSGVNSRNQLGTGGSRITTELTPKPVLTGRDGPPLLGVTAVAVGSPMSCAQLDTGRVACWGDNFHGETGTVSSEATPANVIVRQPTGDVGVLDDVDRLVAHFAHACAHTRSGSWLCWGRNVAGEFGDGSTSNYKLASPLVAVTCP